MSLDFERIKEVRITDVCAKYGISLRFGPEWASAKCPLPSHKEGDKDRTFQVSIKQNYWKCWSASCNEKAGKKGGDVINFVALMEKCSQLDAAKILAEWYGVSQVCRAIKTAPHTEERKEHQKDSLDHSKVSDSVKYMASITAWFDELMIREANEGNEDYRERVLKGVKEKLVQSYRAGQKSK
jgi:hypothetical protein